ncbi:MAG: hypothetical protein WCW27_05150 [Patescibacteria group bacterium]|jgi:hypothetical protein
MIPVPEIYSDHSKVKKNLFSWIKKVTIILGILFIVALLLFLILSKNQTFPVLDSNICEQDWFLDQLALKTKGSCHNYNTERFIIDGKPYDFIDASYNTGMDCESGCITEHYYGLVDLFSRQLYDFFELKNPFEIMRYGKCASFLYEQNFIPYYERRIIKKDQQFYWELVFNNFDPSKVGTNPNNEASCNINGSLIIKSFENDFDSSQLIILPQ